MIAQFQKFRCTACEGTLNRIDNEKYVCEECGEVFDLKGLSNMELSLEEFDKLLLYTLKKRQIVKNRNLNF
jgi:ribosomal protein L37AE/L43A